MTHSLSITRATEADTAAVCMLLRGQFFEHRIELSSDALSAAVEGMVGASRRGTILLARDGRAEVGVAVLATTWTLEHGGHVAWLDELYVVPERRGRGIGGALLRRAQEVARVQGCLALELEIEDAHARAAHLYERAGFCRLDRTRWSIRLAAPSARVAGDARPFASIDHLSLGVSDLVRSRAFYDTVLAPLGLLAYPQPEGDIGYGPPGGEPREGFAFYIGFEDALERRPVVPSAGLHIALRAPTREAVRQFYLAALGAGGGDRGPPGLRPQYHADYYGAFVIDPDGHHLEAVCHDPEL